MRLRPTRGAALAFRVPARDTDARSTPAGSNRPRGAGRSRSTQARYDAARGAVVAYWSKRLAEGVRSTCPSGASLTPTRTLLVQNLHADVALQHRQPVRGVLVPGGRRRRAGAGRAGLRGRRARDPAHVADAAGDAVPELEDGREAARLGDALPPLPATARYVAPGDADAARLRRRARPPDRREPRRPARPRALLVGHPRPGLRPALAGRRLGRGCAAMADAWAQTGHAALAAPLPPARRAARDAACGGRCARRSGGCRTARSSSRSSCSTASAPYGSLTEARLGQLLEPRHAVRARVRASSRPGARRRGGVWRYMLLHGSRLLGLVRAGAYALYGRDAPFPSRGTDQVYGINVARFLADNDEADQLVLSLYGQLAAAMTPEHVRRRRGGERGAARAARATARCTCRRTAPRNAAFLETLRADARARDARPDGARGLELAYATPRAWLARRASGSPSSAADELRPGLVRARGARRASCRRTVELPQRPRRDGRAAPAAARAAAASARSRVGGRPFRPVRRATGTIDLSGLAGRCGRVGFVRSPKLRERARHAAHLLAVCVALSRLRATTTGRRVRIISRPLPRPRRRPEPAGRTSLLPGVVPPRTKQPADPAR